MLGLKSFFENPSWTSILLGVGLFILTLVASMALVSYILVRLPPEYLMRSKRKGPADRWTIREWGWRIGRNLLGVVLILLGIVLSLPAIPGQGLLTMLAGLLLLDLPGKHRFLRWLLRHRWLLDPINRLRERYGKRPLRVSEAR